MEEYQKPWETPKIQMILSIFRGTLVSITPINNTVEVKYEEVDK